MQTLRGVQSSVFIVRLYITSKKRKVETPSDSDSDSDSDPATPEGGSFPTTPEGGSFPLLSQLDGANSAHSSAGASGLQVIAGLQVMVQVQTLRGVQSGVFIVKLYILSNLL